MTYIRLVMLLLVMTGITTAKAQDITGQIVDKDGYAIPYASVSYRGHQIAASSDIDGKFTLKRHAGWTLTVSSVGFADKTIKITENSGNLGRIVLQESSKSLSEVVVKSKRGHYRLSLIHI